MVKPTASPPTFRPTSIPTSFKPSVSPSSIPSASPTVSLFPTSAEVFYPFLQTSFPSTTYACIASSSSGQYVAAVASSKFVYVSKFYGASGSAVSVAVTSAMSTVAVSSTGQYMTAAGTLTVAGYIFYSSNFGTTFTRSGLSDFLTSVAITSTNAANQIAVSSYQSISSSTGYIYYSTNYGSTWTVGGNSAVNFNAVALSTTGAYITAVCYGDYIYSLSGYAFTTAPTLNYISTTSISYYTGVAVSSSGLYQIVSYTGTISSSYPGGYAISTNYGASFSYNNFGTASYSSVSMDSTGQNMFYTVSGGAIYISANYGVNFARSTTALATGVWSSISSSSDAVNVVASVANGYIYGTGTTNPSASPTNINPTSVPTFKPTALTTSQPSAFSTVTSSPTVSGPTAPFVAVGFPSAVYTAISSSSSGQIIAGVVNGGFIYVSNNYGSPGSVVQTGVSNTWQTIAVSSSGQYMTAGGSQAVAGYLYISSNYGSTFSVTTTSDFFTAVAITSGSAANQVAVSSYQSPSSLKGYYYYSTNYGSTWTSGTSVTGKNFQAVAISSTGAYVLIGTYGTYASTAGGYLYRSSGLFSSNPSFITGGNLGYYTGVAMSSNGQYQVATLAYISTGVNSGYALSSDYGATITYTTSTSNNYAAVSMDPTGQNVNYVIVGGGVHVSTNYGATFTVSTSAPSAASWSSITSSADTSVIAASVSGGLIYSTASGYPTPNPSVPPTAAYTNAPVPTISPTGNPSSAVALSPWINLNFASETWRAIATSSSGQYIGAVANTVGIFVSNNYGRSAVLNTATTVVYGIAVSSTGQYMTACGTRGAKGNLWVSSNYGVTFTVVTGKDFFTSVFIVTGNPALQLATSSYLAPGSVTGYIYYTNNYGSLWTTMTTATAKNYQSIAASSTGAYVLAGAYGIYGASSGGYLFTISNFAYTGQPVITQLGRLAYYTGVAVSSSGQYQVAVASGSASTGVNGGVAISTNYGSTFTFTDYGTLTLSDVAMDSTGQYIDFVVTDGGVYVSANYGRYFAASAATNPSAWATIASDSTGLILVAAASTGAVQSTYVFPTSVPTTQPTLDPTSNPTLAPTTAFPTNAPIANPTVKPSARTTTAPTRVPSRSPTNVPIVTTTNPPTRNPTATPTAEPTRDPTKVPTDAPIFAPTAEPTAVPTALPTSEPSTEPTAEPTLAPTAV